MDETALFISWGQPVHGREKQAGKQMRESIVFGRQLENDQRIGRVEWASLLRQGGDLWGFGLLRGTREQVDSLRSSADFARWIVRLTLVCENVAVADAAVDAKALEMGSDLYDDVLDEFEQWSSGPGHVDVHASGEKGARAGHHH